MLVDKVAVGKQIRVSKQAQQQTLVVEIEPPRKRKSGLSELICKLHFECPILTLPTLHRKPPVRQVAERADDAVIRQGRDCIGQSLGAKFIYHSIVHSYFLKNTTGVFVASGRA